MNSEVDIDKKYIKNAVNYFNLENEEDLYEKYIIVQGIGIDTGKNDNDNFKYSVKALKFMEESFHENISNPRVNNMFLNHEMWDIEQMVGRVIYLKFEKDSVNFVGAVNKSHPVADRLSMFKSLSMSVISAELTCSECDKPIEMCECSYSTKRDIIANKAAMIELSFVTMGAYKNAQVKALEYMSNPSSVHTDFSSVLLGESEDKNEGENESENKMNTDSDDIQLSAEDRERIKKASELLETLEKIEKLDALSTKISEGIQKTYI